MTSLQSSTLCSFIMSCIQTEFVQSIQRRLGETQLVEGFDSGLHPGRSHVSEIAFQIRQGKEERTDM